MPRASSGRMSSQETREAASARPQPGPGDDVHPVVDLPVPLVPGGAAVHHGSSEGKIMIRALDRLTVRFMLLFFKLEHEGGCNCGCPNHAVVGPTRLLKVLSTIAVLASVLMMVRSCFR